MRIERWELEGIKDRHPVDRVAVERYGLELRRRGRAFVAYCPFHDDRKTPNLFFIPHRRCWCCHVCKAGGDVIKLVLYLERDLDPREPRDFPRAVARLTGRGGPDTTAGAWGAPTPPRAAGPIGIRAPAARAALAVAVERYHRHLLAAPPVLEHLSARGVAPATVAACRLGFAPPGGAGLAGVLRCRPDLSEAAVAIGLLDRRGRERLGGRVVVPELRGGAGPVWMTGRALPSITPAVRGPRYLDLNVEPGGSKPVFGWAGASGAPLVALVEGVFDWLPLRSWGYPALALGGSHARPALLRGLARHFERVLVLLDNDAGGRAGAAAIVEALGERALAVALPGVNDPGELAALPGGRELFRRALDAALVGHEPFQEALAALAPDRAAA